MWPFRSHREAASTGQRVKTAPSFCYEGFDLDPGQGLLTCRYSLGDRTFTEKISFGPDGPGHRWDSPAIGQAARLIFLLAGVSYYKTAAPAVIDLGQTAVTDAEREFLRTFYLDGLGEFGYRNGLDLSGLWLAGGAGTPSPPPGAAGTPGRGLIPLRGGAGRVRSACRRRGARGAAQRACLRGAGGVVGAARSVHRHASGIFLRPVARARLHPAR